MIFKKSLKIFGRTLLIALGIIGIAFIIFITHSLKTQNFIGNNYLIQKIASTYGIYPDQRPRSSGVEPFDSIEKGEEILISSGKNIIFPTDNINNYYDFLINTNDIQHKIGKKEMEKNGVKVEEDYEDFSSNIIALYFKNTKLSIQELSVYNPKFTKITDPYETIHFRHLGNKYGFIESKYQGDFCIKLYKNTIIHASRNDILPECHTIIIPELRNYPYTKIKTHISALNEEETTTMEVIYKQIKHE